MIRLTQEQNASTKGNISILVLLSLISLVVMFVEIMLVPDLRQVASDFTNGAEWISWVLSIYLLVGGVVTPIIGKLGDIYGTRNLLIIVMIIYLFGLLGSGFSISISNALLGEANIFVLLFFRGVQGIGMGMFPLAFSVIRNVFPQERIPFALGLVSSMFAVGTSIGLVLGGWLTSVDTWNFAFHLVAIPFAVLIVAAFFVVKKEQGVEKGEKIDAVGAALLGVSVFCLLYAVTAGRTDGWTSTKIVSFFVVSAVTGVAFVLWERRSSEPIVKLSLFKNLGILNATLVAFFAGLVMFLYYQTMPFFLETPVALGGYYGFSDTFIVGLHMLPTAAFQFIFGMTGGLASKKYGSTNVMVVGTAIMAIGFLVLTQFNDVFWKLAVSQAILGTGIALAMSSLINVVMDFTPKQEFGVSSGMNTLFRTIGGAIGPALSAAVMAPYIIPGFEELYRYEGFDRIWTVATVFAIVAFLIALIFRKGGKQGKSS